MTAAREPTLTSAVLSLSLTLNVEPVNGYGNR